MRLQVNIVAVEIEGLGKLAIVGLNEREDDMTSVVFMIVLPTNAPLAKYFSDEGLDTKSLLYSIVVEQGFEMMSLPGCDQRVLFFRRTIVGKLRDPRRYLRATADKLADEFNELEVLSSELDKTLKEMGWAEYDIHNPGRRGPMPDFRRATYEAIVTP